MATAVIDIPGSLQACTACALNSAPRVLRRRAGIAPSLVCTCPPISDAATAAKRQQVSPQPAGEFVALQLPPPEAPARDIHIELQRGATMIKIGWPVQAAGDCAAWLREWLR
ncbi:hypothetical protein LJR290_007733 [Variovorax sp. LjRoot290]|uniref:hypothetical protein n=1 Tax=Variovorax sp. LjRoot290 TaxID=3342316 RepID=UPI003ECC4C2F